MYEKTTIFVAACKPTRLMEVDAEVNSKDRMTGKHQKRGWVTN